MSWRTLTCLNLTRKQLGIFLLAFSLIILAATGVIWACADSDESDSSVFAPEYFVNAKYSPFFYTTTEVYYKLAYGDPSNQQFNNIITDEWYAYFNRKFSRSSLKYLLLNATTGAIDSVYQNYSGAAVPLPKTYPDSIRGNILPKQLKSFFNYLQLAKKCESYSVNNVDYWGFDSIKKAHAEPRMDTLITGKFEREDDKFIKERLWFQLVRYYYFDADSDQAIKTVQTFDQYQNDFPNNLTWYRALGYVAGYYHHKHDYALANYMFSLCYNYSYDLEIPSFWSFHPQNESDWTATLKLAKNNEEKITLWQMLGINFDEGRAIKAIYAIDPKSEKLDLLLSRLVNEIENSPVDNSNITDLVAQHAPDDKQLVETIAQKNNTDKPYFWNLAAGYINSLDSNYNDAARYYAIAKKQFPKGDTLVVAQSKVLDILLYMARLKKISAINEKELTEPLNWLADLSKSKIQIPNLRYFSPANSIGDIYQKQGDLLKAVCFNDSSSFYSSPARVQALIDFLNKPKKTPFEKVMFRYYPHPVNDLYYHQALAFVYADEPGKAIAILNKRKLTDKDFELYANPFNSRLNDCHDCDAAAPQKQKFTPLSFLQTLQKMKEELKAGKNTYRDAYLIANAYYNITYYGNGRLFYESDEIQYNSPTVYEDDAFVNNNTDEVNTSMKNAEKYYALARHYAATNEQRARCTFMLSKCALNDIYNVPDSGRVMQAIYIDQTIAANQKYQGYFAELKKKYNKTAYYKEALHECGYFRDYIKNK